MNYRNAVVQFHLVALKSSATALMFWVRTAVHSFIYTRHETYRGSKLSLLHWACCHHQAFLMSRNAKILWKYYGRIQPYCTDTSMIRFTVFMHYVQCNCTSHSTACWMRWMARPVKSLFPFQTRFTALYSKTHSLCMLWIKTIRYLGKYLRVQTSLFSRTTIGSKGFKGDLFTRPILLPTIGGGGGSHPT